MDVLSDEVSSSPRRAPTSLLGVGGDARQDCRLTNGLKQPPVSVEERRQGRIGWTESGLAVGWAIVRFGGMVVCAPTGLRTMQPAAKAKARIVVNFTIPATPSRSSGSAAKVGGQ